MKLHCLVIWVAFKKLILVLPLLVCNNDEWKNKCKNGGKCKDEGGLPQCECTDGFLGDTCEEAKSMILCN